MAYVVCELHGRFFVPAGRVRAWLCPDCEEGLPADPFLDAEVEVSAVPMAEIQVP